MKQKYILFLTILLATSVPLPAAEYIQHTTSHSVKGFDADGNTPLILATAANDLVGIQYLLSRGADVNQFSSNQFNFTPLIFAVDGVPGNIDVNLKLPIIRLLLQRGANINAQDSDGDTALMYAVKAGEPALIKILLAHGADRDVRNNAGEVARNLTNDPALLEIFDHYMVPITITPGASL